MHRFIDAAAHNPHWAWYAIADSAQHRDLPGALRLASNLARCLFNTPEDSPLAAHAPHLVRIEPPSTASRAWTWIMRNADRNPCITLLASTADFDTLYQHLQQFTEVSMPDGDDMFFAFWDPAILGTLMGQPDDATLYVRGPVLNVAQRARLCRHVAAWWYWDRHGELRSLQLLDSAPDQANLPLELNQCQVDDLIEASVPDHVLYHIELNQPQLVAEIDPQQRYSLVRQHLENAREIKLEAMIDLVNYVCAALIYQERFHTDPGIRSLLTKVKNGDLTLPQALMDMP